MRKDFEAPENHDRVPRPAEEANTPLPGHHRHDIEPSRTDRLVQQPTLEGDLPGELGKPAGESSKVH